MSIGVYLQRFTKTSIGGLIGHANDSDLLLVFERAIRALGGSDVDLIVNSDKRGLSVDFPGGSANVYADHALFQLEDLDKVSAELMFEIAKVGDMVIITEGGKHPAILTNPKQWQTLPAGWIDDRDDAPLCGSADELRHLLAGWYDVQARYRKIVQQDFSERAAKEPVLRIPGTQRDNLRDFIYIRARPGETAIAHLRAAIRHYKTRRMNDSSELPKSGLLGSTGGRLEVPNGEVFYALTVSGDKEGWLACLRMFASEEGRLIGQIEGKSSFLLEDGRRFPLSACHYSKAPE